MKPSGFKNIILLYNLLLGKAFSLLVWYVSENTTFKVVVLKQLKKPCIYFKLLPSATKLQRLCFCRRLSVHRGSACSQGVPALGGLLPEGCLLWGVSALGEPAPGGCLLGGVCSQEVVSQHALRQTPHAPGRDGYCCRRYASSCSFYFHYFTFVSWTYQHYKSLR